MKYAVIINGENYGTYSVPSHWDFYRTQRRITRVAKVATRNDVQALTFYSI